MEKGNDNNEVYDLVEVKDERVTTTSLKVAAHFNKEHKDVLRGIKNLGCSEEFGRRNFEPSYYFNEQNKKQPMHDMTRDGFMFLVMGFTGKEAGMMKEKFISAFNAMEQFIINSQYKKIDKEKKPSGIPRFGKVFKDALEMAEGMGLRGWDAKVYACKVVRENTGVELIKGTGIEDMISEAEKEGTHIPGFIREGGLVLGTHERVRSVLLLEVYRKWCFDNGIPSFERNEFYKRLKEEFPSIRYTEAYGLRRLPHFIGVGLSIRRQKELVLTEKGKLIDMRQCRRKD